MSSKGFISKFTKIFPVPKILKFDFVGIDLSEDCVRVMQLKNTKFGRIPWRYKEYQLKERCGIFQKDPTIENCEELIQTLRNVAKDFKVQYANISVPENKIYVYKTEVPRNVGSNIFETLLFGVGENIPLEPSETVIDFFPIRHDRDKIEVIVDAVPRSVLDFYTQFFDQVGIQPIAFEPETHAISRAIIQAEDDNPYLVLNINNQVSNICVIEDGLVQYSQTIPVSGADFVGGFDNDKAKELKEALNKVIIFWFTSKNQEDDEKIQNMYLAGSGGGSNDLVNYLEKNLSINVKFANTWANCFDLNDYIPRLHAKEALGYAAAVGLALKKLE